MILQVPPENWQVSCKMMVRRLFFFCKFALFQGANHLLVSGEPPSWIKGFIFQTWNIQVSNCGCVGFRGVKYHFLLLGREPPFFFSGCSGYIGKPPRVTCWRVEFPTQKASLSQLLWWCFASKELIDAKRIPKDSRMEGAKKTCFLQGCFWVLKKATGLRG